MQKKQLKKSYLKSILILGLLFVVLGFFAHAQENQETPSPETQEEFHDTDDLENMLRDYQKEANKVLVPDDELGPAGVHLEESELQEMTGSSADTKNSPNNLKKKKRVNLQNEASLINQLKDGQLSKSLEVVIKQFEHLSEEDMKKSLREGFKGSKGIEYLDRYPKIEKVAISLMKDKQAIPAFARIFEDREKLLQFGIAFIITIIVNIVIKRSIYKEKKTFLKLVYLYFARVIFIMALRFILIMYFYGENLSPGIKLITQVLKS